MPDITMCDGSGCPKRRCCYRYRAVPSMYQSWFATAPWDGERCIEYWPLEDGYPIREPKIFESDEGTGVPNDANGGEAKE